MLNKEPSPRSTIVILTAIAIAGIALMLSLLSYQFFIIASNKIVDIASHEVRSNVRIEVHDISQILANKLQTVGSLLQTLAESPAIHNNEYKRADIVINTRQQSSSDLTDFYMWLDKNGKINWISNINESTYQKYKGTDLSHRPYFTIPRDTHRAYYSGLMESNDKVARLYISYPIINTTETSGVGTAKGVLTGVVVASIGLNTLGNFLKSQLFPQFNSTIGLLDRNGTILYPNGGQQYVGETVFGDKLRSTLSSLHPPESITTPLNNVSSRSFEGKNGSEDILINGQMKTISYHPVALNGKDFLTLYIIAKHNLTTDVTALINQQRYFTTLIITIIGAVAFIIVFLVFSWNKRLETLVNTRTAELASANDQLKIHDKMQQEFINVAAHELRTPIQPILSITEILHSRIKDSREQELLDVIIRNAKRLNRLSDEILDVTRLEAQTLELKKEQFNLNDVILHAMNDMMSSRGFSSKNLKLLYEPRDMLLKADKSRLAEVISNLLSNAIKFTTEGTITINVEKDEIKNWVVVSVKDTGQGIDVNMLPRLFTKFASKSYQGTGLGLFIAKSIVEAHMGKIWGKNNVDGIGATFSFGLPSI
ncbi:MAG TPA: sensor histidine kinase [Candidatus Eisenbacteria bacterium]|nr:sensor histidine kinase [Candidatus Eisenbacteria bacterium]